MTSEGLLEGRGGLLNCCTAWNGIKHLPLLRDPAKVLLVTGFAKGYLFHTQNATHVLYFHFFDHGI